MKDNMFDTNEQLLIESITQAITEEYGFMVSGDGLLKLLDYPTQNALRIAISNKSISLPIFTLDNRRTKYAFSKDIAEWLVNQRMKNDIRKKHASGKEEMNEVEEKGLRV